MLLYTFSSPEIAAQVPMLRQPRHVAAEPRPVMPVRAESLAYRWRPAALHPQG